MCETLKLDLSEIFHTKGRQSSGEYAPELGQISVCGSSYEVCDGFVIRLHFENLDMGEIRLTGESRVTLSAPCDRCLKPVEIPVELTFDRVLREDPGDTEDPDSEAFLQEGMFDIPAFLGEELTLHMPMKILCREDCKGLCPVCGKDLNESSCGCDTFVPDPRMAAIADIFRKADKEV